MATSDSSPPASRPRKLVLRKIQKEASEPGALPKAKSVPPPPLVPPPHPPRTSAVPPAWTQAAAPRAPTPGSVHPEFAAPAPAAAALPTPMPSRVSVLPMVASLAAGPPGSAAQPRPSIAPQRSVLIAAAVAACATLVAAVALLGAHRDPVPRAVAVGALTEAPSAATSAAPLRVHPQLPAPSESTRSTPPLIFTANVNDLPRAPSWSASARGRAVVPPPRPPAALPSRAPTPAPSATDSVDDTSAAAPPASAPVPAAPPAPAVPPAAAASAAPAATPTTAQPAESGSRPSEDPLLREMERSVHGADRTN
jgi:hypothetical protein